MLLVLNLLAYRNTDALRALGCSHCPDRFTQRNHVPYGQGAGQSRRLRVDNITNVSATSRTHSPLRTNVHKS